jgi:hypothetical protein
MKKLATRFIAALIVTWLAACASQATPTPTNALNPTSTSSESAQPTLTVQAGVQVYTNLDPAHTPGEVDCPQTPPVGGPHNPVWQNCGVYTEPVKNEHAVHSLEHGAVWITYQPELDTAQVEKLAEITRQSSHRLLSPYPGIDSPIVVTAWGYQLKLTSADDPQLMAFIQQYEQSPDGPEPGAPCDGAEGRTAQELGG